MDSPLKPYPTARPELYPEQSRLSYGYLLNPMALDKQRTSILRYKVPDTPLKLGRDVTQYIINMLDLGDIANAYLLRDVFGGDLGWMVDAMKRRTSMLNFLSPIVGRENVDSLITTMLECDVLLGGWRVAEYFI